jgi:hypothetical protein
VFAPSPLRTSHCVRAGALSNTVAFILLVVARPERRVVRTGESPVRVSAGAPGSRLRLRGEIRATRRSVKSPCKRGEQTDGLQRSVNAVASTKYQPKGVWESRASHVMAKATDSILDRNGCWISPGSQAAARWERITRNRRDPTRQPSRAKAEHIRSEG